MRHLTFLLFCCILSDYERTILLFACHKLNVRLLHRYSFIRTQQEVLSTHPALTVQLAANSPFHLLPARLAEAQLQLLQQPSLAPDVTVTEHKTPVILRWVNKPLQYDRPHASLKLHRGVVSSIRSAGLGLWVSAGEDGSAQIWDGCSLQRLRCIHTFGLGLRDVCWLADDGRGAKLACAGDEGKISVYSVAAGGALLRVLDGHSDRVTCLASGEDMSGAELFVSGSSDNTLRLWDPNQDLSLATLEGHGAPVTCVAMRGALILSASWDKSLILWRYETGKSARVLARFRGHSDGVMTCMCCLLLWPHRFLAVCTH